MGMVQESVMLQMDTEAVKPGLHCVSMRAKNTGGVNPAGCCCARTKRWKERPEDWYPASATHFYGEAKSFLSAPT